MSRQPICIKPSEFIADNLVISEIKENQQMKLAKISYLNDQKQPCDLYISLPTVETYGPYAQYRYGIASKVSKHISGYTISYQNKETNKLFKTIQEII